MPLTMLNKGIEAIIQMCHTKDTTKKFLEGLGILPGTRIMVISENNGNLIIAVKGTRLSINRGIAQKVYVEAV